MNIVKKHLSNGQYLTTIHEKKYLFTHHTVGLSAMSAWRWWDSTPERVGTAYIIDYDGVIYECFDPTMWAYHLGISKNKHYLHKHSIGIELVSGGPLYKEGDEFRFYPLWPNKQRYNVIPLDQVYEFKKEWRGIKYLHKYSEEQLDSLKWLVGRITLDFPTIEIGNDIEASFDYNTEVADGKLPGIWPHSAVRTDKNDPAPYPPLIKALKEVQKEIQDVRKTVHIPEVKIVGKKKKP